MDIKLFSKIVGNHTTFTDYLSEHAQVRYKQLPVANGLFGDPGFININRSCRQASKQLFVRKQSVD